MSCDVPHALGHAVKSRETSTEKGARKYTTFSLQRDPGLKTQSMLITGRPRCVSNLCALKKRMRRGIIVTHHQCNLTQARGFGPINKLTR